MGGTKRKPWNWWKERKQNDERAGSYELFAPQYFWSALATENAITFSKLLKAEGMPRFEDVMEDFRDRFNDRWLRS